jgi:hypothetical protein
MLMFALSLVAASGTAGGHAPQSAFWAALRRHCGKAYAGRLVTRDRADLAMANAAMVMHVHRCAPKEVRVAFHVETPKGWDRSRTWVLTRQPRGLRLKHDHRHADGARDEITNYGGDAADAGTTSRQTFPADGESRALFARTGRQISLSNVWAVEVTARVFAYELRREGENVRHFRVEFDLAKPVPAPPSVWGG